VPQHPAEQKEYACYSIVLPDMLYNLLVRIGNRRKCLDEV